MKRLAMAVIPIAVMLAMPTRARGQDATPVVLVVAGQTAYEGADSTGVFIDLPMGWKLTWRVKKQIAVLVDGSMRNFQEGSLAMAGKAVERNGRAMMRYPFTQDDGVCFEFSMIAP